MGHVLHLAPIIETEQFCCQTATDEGAICGFTWSLKRPSSGMATYKIGCLRCGHAYQVNVQSTPKPKPTPPQPKHTGCLHNRGTGYTDQRGRHRCSACGELL